MKKALKVILFVFLAFVILIAGVAFFLTRGLDEVSKVDISSIDASNVKDGTYEGTYESGRWSNTVTVTVKDGKITDIQVKDDVTFPQKGLSDEIFKRVMDKQNANVDAVTGATVTSKAYMKAIEDALKSGK
jgi:uncharacterized protein with FMN-binding domain